MAPEDEPLSARMSEAVSFRQALVWWFKLGCISFGGPAGQIAIMHAELVEKRRWISEKRFLHALNYCMFLPGPEAQQLATYIGWLMHGVKGGIAAGALFVLPSLLVLVVLSWAYMAFGATRAADLLYGIKPAVVALIAFAAYRLGVKVLRQPALWLVAGAALASQLLLPIPFPAMIAAAALFGWLYRRRLRADSKHAVAAAASHAPALIDDATPTPPHARFSRARLAAALAIGLGLWAAALWALFAWHGGGVLTTMSLFFTKAALVTFGGAYAVMPYVFQNAVQTYGWLSAPQMMDGLALGETTPGPLIMVVAFIGFVGAWSAAPAGDPLLSGIAGAAVATFFTFLPSFVFIFLGAPLVERTREDFKLSGPLTAISAAVVGAILALALHFAGTVFRPEGHWDGFALALALLGWLALYRGWLGMMPVIGLSAVTGAAWRMLG